MSKHIIIITLIILLNFILSLNDECIKTNENLKTIISTFEEHRATTKDGLINNCEGLGMLIENDVDDYFNLNINNKNGKRFTCKRNWLFKESDLFNLLDNGTFYHKRLNERVAKCAGINLSDPSKKFVETDVFPICEYGGNFPIKTIDGCQKLEAKETEYSLYKEKRKIINLPVWIEQNGEVYVANLTLNIAIYYEHRELKPASHREIIFRGNRSNSAIALDCNAHNYVTNNVVYQDMTICGQVNIYGYNVKFINVLFISNGAINFINAYDAWVNFYDCTFIGEFGRGFVQYYMCNSYGSLVVDWYFESSFKNCRFQDIEIIIKRQVYITHAYPTSAMVSKDFRFENNEGTTSNWHPKFVHQTDDPHFNTRCFPFSKYIVNNNKFKSVSISSRPEDGDVEGPSFLTCVGTVGNTLQKCEEFFGSFSDFEFISNTLTTGNIIVSATTTNIQSNVITYNDLPSGTLPSLFEYAFTEVRVNTPNASPAKLVVFSNNWLVVGDDCRYRATPCFNRGYSIVFDNQKSRYNSYTNQYITLDHTNNYLEYIYKDAFEIGFGYSFYTNDVNKIQHQFGDPIPTVSGYQTIANTIRNSDFKSFGKSYDIAINIQGSLTSCEFTCKTYPIAQAVPYPNECGACGLSQSSDGFGLCDEITRFDEPRTMYKCIHTKMYVERGSYRDYINLKGKNPVWLRHDLEILGDPNEFPSFILGSWNYENASILPMIITSNKIPGSEIGGIQIGLTFRYIQIVDQTEPPYVATSLFETDGPNVAVFTKLIFYYCNIQGLHNNVPLFNRIPASTQFQMIYCNVNNIYGTVGDLSWCSSSYFLNNHFVNVMGPLFMELPLHTAPDIYIGGDTLNNFGVYDRILAPYVFRGENAYWPTVKIEYITAGTTNFQAMKGVNQFDGGPESGIPQTSYTCYFYLEHVQITSPITSVAGLISPGEFEYGLSYTNVINLPCSIPFLKTIRLVNPGLKGSTAVVICDQGKPTELYCDETICSDILSNPPPSECIVDNTVTSLTDDYGYIYFPSFYLAMKWCRKLSDSRGYVDISVKCQTFSEGTLNFTKPRSGTGFRFNRHSSCGPPTQPILIMDKGNLQNNVIFNDMDIRKSGSGTIDVTTIPSNDQYLFYQKSDTFPEFMVYNSNIDPRGRIVIEFYMISLNSTFVVETSTVRNCYPFCFYVFGGSFTNDVYRDTHAYFIGNSMQNIYGNFAIIRNVRENIIESGTCIENCGMMMERVDIVGASLFHVMGNAGVRNGIYRVAHNNVGFSSMAVQQFGNPFYDGGGFINGYYSVIVMENIPKESVLQFCVYDNTINDYPNAIRFIKVDNEVTDMCIDHPPPIDDIAQLIRGIWYKNPNIGVSNYYDILFRSYPQDAYDCTFDTCCNDGCMPTSYAQCIVSTSFSPSNPLFGTYFYNTLSSALVGNCPYDKIFVNKIDQCELALVPATAAYTITGKFCGVIYFSPTTTSISEIPKNSRILRKNSYRKRINSTNAAYLLGGDIIFEDFTLYHDVSFGLKTIYGMANTVAFNNMDMYGTVSATDAIFLDITTSVTINKLSLHDYMNNGIYFNYYLGCTSTNTFISIYDLNVYHAHGYALKIEKVYKWNMEKVNLYDCSPTSTNGYCMIFAPCSIDSTTNYFRNAIIQSNATILANATIMGLYKPAAYLFNLSNFATVPVSTKLPVYDITSSGYPICYKIDNYYPSSTIIDAKFFIRYYALYNPNCKGTSIDVLAGGYTDASTKYCMKNDPLCCVGLCPFDYTPYLVGIIIAILLCFVCLACGCCCIICAKPPRVKKE